MNIEKQLKQVFEVIIKEVKTNEEFAKKIEAALEKEAVEIKAKRRGRQPALINPNIVVERGEDILKEELEKLEVAQLKDVICQYTMDPAKLTSRWKSKEKLMNYITEVTLARNKKGDAFR